ncbi:hypothetical protein GUJ93_ZPchr0007g3596 [Zizania palustris]|uniref:X8 domain-containing protein n=1 Tax=Zizania palustris TaxID=103762 RepID=A0A8J5W479_ZIZPA|nr:hypothetical protein GUJ93_ZPchr0007g3596 [Zizania palustris]
MAHVAFAAFLFLLLVGQCLAGKVGICYGRNADDLPTPDKVVQLIQQQSVKYVRIYDTNIDVIKTFANSGVELMVGVPNADLLPFAQYQSNVDTWLKNSILPYYPATMITHITVGAEVTESPVNVSALVVPAMRNVHAALKKVGLHKKITISSTHSLGILSRLDWTGRGNVDIMTGGNITNANGSWCVASANASETDLQNGLNWACGPGNVDCSAIQPSQPCYQPDTLASHASYAFNSYYQQNGANDVACDFAGTGLRTTKDPSYDTCVYMAAGKMSTTNSSIAPVLNGSSRSSRLDKFFSLWLPMLPVVIAACIM